jgi:hypothetical protein
MTGLNLACRISISMRLFAPGAGRRNHLKIPSNQQIQWEEPA